MSQENSDQLNRLRADARTIFEAAVKRVQPKACIGQYCHRQGDILQIGEEAIDLNQVGDVYLIGAGKASAAMAAAMEPLLGDRISGGLINVKYGHTAPLEYVELVEAGHPVPDENGVKGAEEILRIASRAKQGDLVICLLSGGGSALTPLPAEGISLADKQEVTRVMLACGATIHEINTLRKHLSAIKGGLLAKAVEPARLFSLILSDVVGDDLDVIASGLTVPDSSTFADCLAIIDKFGIRDQLPAAVISRLHWGAEGRVSETPKAADPIFANTRNLIIGSNSDALQTAQKAAEELGYNTLVLSSMIEGETRHIAAMHGAIAREILKSGQPVAAPACVLSGGETTVTITGSGKGGRNQEFALAGALDLAGSEPAVIFSGGTDGNDGPTDAAGALADGRTVDRGRAKGLEARTFLNNNDAYHFFQALDDLVITGPTNTNVMDLRLIMVGGDEG